MRLSRIIIAGIAFAFILFTAAVPAVFAGAQDTGALASCELASPKGIHIHGTAGVTIDPDTTLAVASFQTRADAPGRPFVVIRAQLGLDLGTSPMEIVCQILNEPTAEGPLVEDPTPRLTGPSLAQQILAAVGLPNRTIKITKRSIFGCNDLNNCDNPGRRPDFAAVPNVNFPIIPNALTALGDVVLFAVKP
jgi:hypothetical protein